MVFCQHLGFPLNQEEVSTDESYVIYLHLDNVNKSQVHVDDTATADDTETVATITNDPDIPGTPKQTSVSLLRETVVVADDNEVDVSITTYDTNEGNTTFPGNSWCAPDDTADVVLGFRQVHYCLFDTADTWVMQSSIKQHPFSLQWQRAVYGGLMALTEWDRVAKLFKLSTMQDYVNLMNQCPSIQNATS